MKLEDLLRLRAQVCGGAIDLDRECVGHLINGEVVLDPRFAEMVAAKLAVVAAMDAAGVETPAEPARRRGRPPKSAESETPPAE